jgi:FtsP/CotA-like multicopper oxidase with cupredoxin domain
MDWPKPARVLGGLAVIGVLAWVAPLGAQTNGAIYTQCPGDSNGDGIPDVTVPGHPAVKCMHLAAGDGWVTMADGKPLYTFGFADVTGKVPAQVVNESLAAANFPAPTIRLKEGQEFYLSLTNVGMILRPDLFDQHSVHFHGFPQAASIFDGVPESSATVNMGASFTYYYKIMDPGTYMYHCHVEATEHMQMGMLGNLYVEPRQNKTGCPGGACPVARLEGGSAGAPLGYVYNDRDGSTAYDVEKEIQIGSFDPNFHDQHIAIQPLPFAAMDDKYAMLNGRGYPDTINPGVISTDAGFGNKPSQPINALVTATAGQRVLLRISNLAVTRFYTLASTIPMHVVGHSARLLRGPGGTNLYYDTNSVTLGGGESIDVILNTAGVAPGTYALYTTNLNYLSNDGEDFGGMMTEIRIQ